MGRTRQDDDELKVVFGRGIRCIRERLVMKQETLAQAVGYGGHSQIAKIERGQTVPSFGQALRLAGVLQVTLEAVIRAGRGESWETTTGGQAVPVVEAIATEIEQLVTTFGASAQRLAALVGVPVEVTVVRPRPGAERSHEEHLLPAFAACVCA